MRIFNSLRALESFEMSMLRCHFKGASFIAATSASARLFMRTLCSITCHTALT